MSANIGQSKRQPRGTDQEEARMRALGLSTGWNVFSYMISGLIGYGLIGWLLAKFTHVQFLFPAGLLLGVVVSVGFVIYRYGRAEKRQDEQAIQGPTAEQAQNSRAGTGRNDR
jgi:ATP synthase protein I